MSKETSKKIVGVVTSSLLVAGVGAAAAVPVLTPQAADDAVAIEAASGQTVDTLAKEAAVQGVFSYDQNAVSATSDLQSIFTKAAATLCATSASLNGERIGDIVIDVSREGGSTFAVNASEAGDDENAVSKILGCVCASNLPGGGAAANAEVSGISLADLYAQAR